jgi:hypothetical protein
MTHEIALPAPGLAEVRVTAATPDVARLVAQVLRTWFAATEERSRPAGDIGTGTRLELVVDTTRTPRLRTDAQDRPSAAAGSAVAGARQIWP